MVLGLCATVFPGVIQAKGTSHLQLQNYLIICFMRERGREWGREGEIKQAKCSIVVEIQIFRKKPFSAKLLKKLRNVVFSIEGYRSINTGNMFLLPLLRVLQFTSWQQINKTVWTPGFFSTNSKSLSVIRYSNFHFTEGLLLIKSSVFQTVGVGDETESSKQTYSKRLRAFL